MKFALLALCALLAVTGCATSNRLVAHSAADATATRDEVAMDLYSSAKKCWSRKGEGIRPDVVVDSVVTLDSVMVSARFNSLGSGVMNPFLRFIVTNNGNQTRIALHTQEIEWKDQERHVRDARNWMAGGSGCS